MFNCLIIKLWKVQVGIPQNIFGCKSGSGIWIIFIPLPQVVQMYSNQRVNILTRCDLNTESWVLGGILDVHISGSI